MQKLTWQAVAFLAVIGGVVVALATLTDWSSESIIAILGVLGGIGGGAALAGGVSHRMDGVSDRMDGVSDRVEQVHAETVAQTPVLDQVARRVNGELDERIANAQQEAAEQGAALVISELRKTGVLPHA